MNHSRKIDQDAVLRARVLLLGSGGIGLKERVDAYRVLAEVSPKAYLPLLSRWLLALPAERNGFGPDTELRIVDEAVAAARRIHEDWPGRYELLTRALQARAGLLRRAGRPEESLAVCEEVAALSAEAYRAGRVASPVHGLGTLADGLTDVGRHAEAAVLRGRIVADTRAGERSAGDTFREVVRWVTALDRAGQPDAALDALAQLVADNRADLRTRSRSPHGPLWTLLCYARRLDARGGRAEEAGAARREAGEVRRARLLHTPDAADAPQRVAPAGTRVR
ncbi:hypothetical protein [Streptomyces bambusae]|uniref:Tetratricopeptide repeat protein n=1 Tax=Streptomyces bambusae TaxID=1550616 RepID=A0ABS6ZD21_9ACTN|nr:hypothetical protein [Streptomyces bambusae]MBW5485334.1 hypothetical protein [Streptomyces bambusae]